MSFRKDLMIFGEKDDVCPHCGIKFVIPCVTPESLLFEEFNSCLDSMMDTLTDPLNPIVSTSKLKDISTLLEEEKVFAESEVIRLNKLKKPQSEDERIRAEKRRAKILAKKKGVGKKKELVTTGGTENT